MIRFFLHVRSARGEFRDGSGHEFADLARARMEAIRIIRELTSEQILDGELDPGLTVTIQDNAAHTLATIAFEEAITMLDDAPFYCRGDAVLPSTPTLHDTAVTNYPAL